MILRTANRAGALTTRTTMLKPVAVLEALEKSIQRKQRVRVPTVE